MSDSGAGSSGLEVPLGADPSVVLFAERLRDGRVALGTRKRQDDGGWAPGELHLLDSSAFLALAGWLTSAVEDAWLGTIRERQGDQLRTADELYGQGPAAVERLAHEMLSEISPVLLRRAATLLINSIGPDARERLVLRLNRTTDLPEEAVLRRQLAEEREAFAYGVAAAALFDAIERGVAAGEKSAG